MDGYKAEEFCVYQERPLFDDALLECNEYVKKHYNLSVTVKLKDIELSPQSNGRTNYVFTFEILGFARHD